jgi:hypothetical protein
MPPTRMHSFLPARYRYLSLCVNRFARINPGPVTLLTEPLSPSSHGLAVPPRQSRPLVPLTLPRNPCILPGDYPFVRASRCIKRVTTATESFVGFLTLGRQPHGLVHP